MRSFVDTLKKYSLLRCIFYLLLGLAMLIFPDSIVLVIVYILGAYAALSGVFSIITARKTGGSMVGGILLIALGVLLVVFNQLLPTLFFTLIGVFMILIGVLQLVQSITAHKNGGKLNIFQLILGLLVLVGGVAGIINPFGGTTVLVMVFGVVALIMAVNEFSLYLSLRKAGNTPGEL